MSIINRSSSKIHIRTCRICLEANNVDMVLLEEQNGWLQLFEFCFGFALTTQDEPRLLCKTCAETVQSYVRFKEKCQKSHNLWRSVISDVKCYLIKHTNIENTSTNQYVNDSIIRETQIKDEPIDALDTELDNNDDEIEDFLSDDVKIETEEKNRTLNNGENTLLVRKQEDLKHLRNKIQNRLNTNRHDRTECKEKKTYTCVNCKVKIYVSKRCYLKHLKKCQVKATKRREKQTFERRIFDQEYAYDCGRKYDNSNVSKVEHDTKSDKNIHREIIKIEEDSYFPCGLCKLTFGTTKEMYSHLNDHWTNNDLSCKICDFIGVDLAAISAHRFAHLPYKGKLSFLCHLCQKPSLSLLALHFHYRKDHLNKSGGYCSRCNREFIKLRHWKRHELYTHYNNRYICDICGKGFYYRHVIEEHMLDHMQCKKCVCDICGNTFARQRYLKLHKATVHSNSGPLKCNHCNRLFKSEHTLSIHQKIVAREKTLQCKVCHKLFITPNVLNLHMTMHSKERPYRCDVCSCSYKYKSNLTAHLLKHSGFPSHKCLLCTKSFLTAKALRRHSSVHTGVRSHRCTIPGCTRSFHSKKLMLAHLELRHKNENVGEK